MLQPFRLSKAFFTFGFGWFPGGRCLSCELLCLAVLCKQTCSHLDLIYLAATQARMVKRDFASPSRVLFVLLRKTKTQRPRTRTRAAMASSRPNVFLRSAKKNCPRVPLTGRSGIFRMPSRATSSNSKCHLHATGLQRHWAAPGPAACDRFINFICPQVMAPSTSTAPASWREGQGRCLYQTSLKLNAPVRLPKGTWPVLIWGLQVVADMDRWQELGSPRHLLYITRPLSPLVAF